VAQVVIVGAGLGGLAAAARLADFGHGVTVLEQAPTVGGSVGTFVRDGFKFDTGPTSFTLPAVFRDLFRKTGRPLDSVIDLAPVEPACRYRFVDGVDVDLPNTSRAGAMRALEGALGAGAGHTWDSWLRHGERTWRAVRGAVTESPPTSRDLLRLAIRPGDVHALGLGRSLRALVARSPADVRLRMLLERFVADAGSDPRRAPSALAVLPYVEQTFGMWHVRGGMHRLAEATCDRALERGARVRTGVAVDAILTSGGRASGVHLADGELMPADVVVANADAEPLYRDLIDSPRERRRSERCGRAPSVFTILLALRGRTPGLSHRTVLFPAETDSEFDMLFGEATGPVGDPTLYVSSPDDPALRPGPDAEGWTVHVRAPRHGSAPSTVDWTATGLAEAYGDRVMAVLAARGLDIRDRVLWRVVLTPYDRERTTGSGGGSLGPSFAGLWSLTRRPANRSSVPGLFLVGASTRPGGSVPFVGLSASMVADLIGRA
jgi:phytoene desaturase